GGLRRPRRGALGRDAPTCARRRCTSAVRIGARVWLRRSSYRRRAGRRSREARSAAGPLRFGSVFTVLLYNSQISGNCYKVRLLLAHLGIEYERREVDVADRSNRPELLGGLNPSLRVPTLVLD